jgi:hypothetical protein
MVTQLEAVYEGLVDMLHKGEAGCGRIREGDQLLESKHIAANFCTIELTLHKSVLYASNHGYVHPNETDY